MKNKGVALLLALFSLIIISLLVVALLELTTIDLQITSNHLKKNQALYIAEAGVEYAISQLRYNRNWKRTIQPINFPPGSGNTYDVTYSNNSGTITSVGTVRILTSDESVSFSLEVKVYLLGNNAPYKVKIIYWREL